MLFIEFLEILLASIVYFLMLLYYYPKVIKKYEEIIIHSLITLIVVTFGVASHFTFGFSPMITGLFVIFFSIGNFGVYLRYRSTESGKEEVLEKKEHFREFWGDFVVGKFKIVHPPSDVDPTIKREIWREHVALNKLLDELRESFPEIETEDYERKSFDRLLENERKQNLIVQSGPIQNDITRVVLERPETVYKFLEEDGEIQYDIISNKNSEFRKKPSWEKHGDHPDRDYGIITCIPNPYNRSNEVIVSCGSHAWGTETGFELLTDEKTLRYINEKAGKYFQAICTVEIDKDGNGHEKHLLDLHPDEEIREKTIVDLFPLEG